jgi:hypothetical protein
MNKHGLFVKGGHPSDEMRAKIRSGIMRHWQTRERSPKRVAEQKRSIAIDRWLAEELAKAGDAKC